MSEKRKLAEEIFLALHGEDVFKQVWTEEYDKRKKRIIDVIESGIPDVVATHKDPYLVGLRESEIRVVLKFDYPFFKDEKNLDTIIEAMGEFNHGSLWSDVIAFADAFIKDSMTASFLHDLKNVALLSLNTGLTLSVG